MEIDDIKAENKKLKEANEMQKDIILKQASKIKTLSRELKAYEDENLDSLVERLENTNHYKAPTGVGSPFFDVDRGKAEIARQMRTDPTKSASTFRR